MCLGCSEHTKDTRNHLVKCSGIEAAIMGLCRGLDGHHQLERGAHICLDVVLNDERYIRNVRGVGGNKRRNGQGMENMSWVESGS